MATYRVPVTTSILQMRKTKSQIGSSQCHATRKGKYRDKRSASALCPPPCRAPPPSVGQACRKGFRKETKSEEAPGSPLRLHTVG